MTWRQKNRTAWALVALAAVCLVLGLIRGEHTVVWRKAVNLCMECIGLG